MSPADRTAGRRGLTLAALGIAVLAVAVLAVLWGWSRGTSDARSIAPPIPASSAARAVAEGDAGIAPMRAEHAPITREARTGSEPSATPELDLEVVVARSYRSDAELLPGLRVRVGFGYPDPQPDLLAEGRTDDDGRAAFTLSRERLYSGEELHAWIAEEGWQERARLVRLPSDRAPTPTQPVVVRVATTEGATLPGRLFGADGRPSDGKVRLHEVRPDARLGYGDGSRTGDEGWFAIDFPRPGRFEVLAEGASGTAVLRDLALDPARQPDPIELTLAGPGVVLGRVRDGAGRPAAGLDLLVLLAEFDDEEGRFILPEPRATRLRLEGRGRLWRTLTTGVDGEFEATGLRGGDWVVRTRRRSGGPYPIRLSAPVAALGEPLDLVFDREHLVVRALDALGKPMRVEHWTTRPRIGLQEWPGKPHVWVAPADSTDSLEMDFGAALPGRRTPADELVFEVEPGQEYRVGLLGGAVPFAETRVAVPERAGRVEVELRASAPVERGTLLVTVLGPDGVPMTRHLALRLEDPVTGTPLLVRDSFYRVDWPFRWEVPAGRYRLVARGEPTFDGYHGTLLAPRPFGRFEVLTEVVPGLETRVVATLPEGARIALTLRGEPDARDHAAAREEAGEEDPEWAEQLASRVELALLDDVGRVAQWVWFHDGEYGSPRWSFVPMPSEGTSQVLFSGRFTLRATTAGGRTTRSRVTLIDGETTSVDLRFE